jgi:hypothetical protein
MLPALSRCRLFHATVLLPLCLPVAAPVGAQFADGDVWVLDGAPKFEQFKKLDAGYSATLGETKLTWTQPPDANRKGGTVTIEWDRPPERLVVGERCEPLAMETSTSPDVHVYAVYFIPGARDGEGEHDVASWNWRANNPSTTSYSFVWRGAEEDEAFVQVYCEPEGDWAVGRVTWSYKWAGAGAKPPRPPAGQTSEPPKDTRPLWVQIALDSSCYGEAEGLQGKVIVIAPEEVKPGTTVTVAAGIVPNERGLFLDMNALLWGGGGGTTYTDPDTIAGSQDGGGKRQVVLDDTRRGSIALGDNGLLLTAPELQGRNPLAFRVVAAAEIGAGFKGSAEAPFAIGEDPKGARLVALEFDPNPPQAGQTLRIWAEIAVDDPDEKEDVLVEAEGRLIWQGAPADQWIGAEPKVPPTVSLPREDGVTVPVEGQYGTTVAYLTLQTTLKGPGLYLGNIAFTPRGYSMLTVPVNFTAVDAASAQPTTATTEPEPAANGQSQQVEGPPTEPRRPPPPDAPPGTTNLAYKKPAGQCCTVNNDSARHAGRGTDGDTRGSEPFMAGSTCGQPGAPNWTVNLGQLADVDEIRLYNCSDDPTRWNPAHSRYVEVFVASKPGAQPQQVYARQESGAWGLDGKPLIISLKGQPAAVRQFCQLWVTVHEGEPGVPLVLSEVEIYGRFLDGSTTIQPPTPPPAGDGARRGTEGGEPVTYGPLKLDVRDGKVIVREDTDLPGGGQLPRDAELTSLSGESLQGVSAERLADMLKEYKDGSVQVGVRLPNGTEITVTIMDE